MTMTLWSFLTRTATPQAGPLALGSPVRLVQPLEVSLLVEGFLW